MRVTIAAILLVCTMGTVTAAPQQTDPPASPAAPPFIWERTPAKWPVRIVTMSTSAGERWLRDLAVEVENVSPEPIYAIRYGVVFTQFGWPTSSLESELTFGSFDPELVNEPDCPGDTRVSLAPGARAVLRLSADSLAALEVAVAAPRLLQPSPIELVREFVQMRRSHHGSPVSTRSKRSVGVTTAQPERIGAIALSPDGRTLALARRADEIELVIPGAPPRTIRYEGGAPGVTALEFSPAGHELLVCTVESATLIDVATGRPLRRTPLGGAYTATVSADLSYVVTAHNKSSVNEFMAVLGVIVTLSPYGGYLGFRDKSEIIGYELSSGRRTKLLGRAHISAMSLSADGGFLALLNGYESKLQLVDRRTRRVTKKLEGTATGLALNPKGDMLAFIQNGSVVILATATGREIARIASGPTTGTALRFAPNGAALAACGAQGATVWSVPSGQVLLESCGRYVPAARGMAFSADGRTFAVAAGEQPKLFTLRDPR